MSHGQHVGILVAAVERRLQDFGAAYEGAKRWYVDENVVDCDLDLFLEVVTAALEGAVADLSKVECPAAGCAFSFVGPAANRDVVTHYLESHP